MVVSDAFLKRAAEEGLRVREYAPPPGGSVQCTVTAEDDILVGRLAANLSAAKRVDLCICDDRGIEQIRAPNFTGIVRARPSVVRLSRTAPSSTWR